MGPNAWLIVDAHGAFVLIQPAIDVPGFDLPQLVGLGVLGPAMLYAYRLNVRAIDRGLQEAVKANERKDQEIDRLRAENDRLRARLYDTGPRPTRMHTEDEED